MDRPDPMKPLGGRERPNGGEPAGAIEASGADQDPGVLTRAISAQLRTARFGRPLHVYASAGSTNDLARELAAAGAGEGTAVIALEQVEGRGRLGRRWISPPGGLYLSVVLRPTFPRRRWPLIGLACALGAAAAVEAHTRQSREAGRGRPEGRDASVRVKWPNDVLLGGGKVGGILVEVVGDAAVCGIGLNLTASPRSGTRSGPSEAAYLATRNPAVSVAAVAPDVLFECERRYLALEGDPGAMLAEWRARTATLGRSVRVTGAEPIEGIAEDIDADGALLVRTAAGIRRVLAGDVVIARWY